MGRRPRGAPGLAGWRGTTAEKGAGDHHRERQQGRVQEDTSQAPRCEDGERQHTDLAVPVEVPGSAGRDGSCVPLIERKRVMNEGGRIRGNQVNECAGDAGDGNNILRGTAPGEHTGNDQRPKTRLLILIHDDHDSPCCFAVRCQRPCRCRCWRGGRIPGGTSLRGWRPQGRHRR